MIRNIFKLKEKDFDRVLKDLKNDHDRVLKDLKNDHETETRVLQSKIGIVNARYVLGIF
jgi:hypothetical protein